MNTEIIVALIAAVGSAAGSLGGILISSGITKYRIGELEKKVEKHNKVVERVYRIEQHEAVIDEEIKVANRRIDDLEEINK